MSARFDMIGAVALTDSIGETSGLTSQRRPDRGQTQKHDDEAKSMEKSRHQRSRGIDGLDWLADSSEKAGVFPATSSLNRKLNGITSK